MFFHMYFMQFITDYDNIDQSLQEAYQSRLTICKGCHSDWLWILFVGEGGMNSRSIIEMTLLANKSALSPN